MSTTIETWKRSLARLLALYDEIRHPFPRFFSLLFLFFVLLNLGCYWFAMYTVFPGLTQGEMGTHYFWVQFPVGFLGAVFDALSFFVTIFIIRRALRATSAGTYVLHLSVDLLIAIIATWWVLFVFTVSGWIISLVDTAPQQLLSDRAVIYEDLALAALANPRSSIRNIYFGVVMGVSAIIPTAVHIYLSMKAFVEVHVLRVGTASGSVG